MNQNLSYTTFVNNTHRAQTNSVLFERVKSLVQAERRIGTEILEILQEIERRKAYADLKYDGLFSYCVKELAFTEAQAFHRIQAMRALKELPEIKPLIESGALAVSSVSKVQVQLRQEKKIGIAASREEKLALFESVKNQTSKEVDRSLAERRGEKLKAKLVLELDEEAEALWTRVKNLSAHKTQGDSTQILIMLMEAWVQKNDPELQAKTCKEKVSNRVTPSKAAGTESRGVSQERVLLTKVTDPQVSVQKAANQTRVSSTQVEAKKSSSSARNLRKPISSGLKRQIWNRDQGKCTHCGGRHALQIDHRLPVAKSGENSEANLRLLCRSCNLTRPLEPSDSKQ